ncbi:MAG: flagellar hook-length control protein FliK [Alphaproteobacteria bacterium]
MISTSVTFLLDRTLPPQSGRASQAADVTAAGDFADLMSRLFYSNMPVAALALAAEIPDTTIPLPSNDKIEPERTPEEAGRAERRDTESAREDQAEAAERPESERPAPAASSTTADRSLPQDAEAISSAAAFPLLQPPPQAAPILATPPAQQAGERPLAQGVTPFIQPKEGDAPQAVPQQARPAPAGAGDAPRIQIVDGSAKDQPPPLGHMLSGRAAVIAQSGDDGNPALSKDTGAGLKGGLAEQPAASLFGGAAQASSMAAQKAKGPSKPANAAGAGQNAGGAQPAQSAATQAQQTASAAAATTPQAGFGSALAAANNGSGQPGSLSPQTARSEQFPLAGTGAGTGAQQLPQGNFRAAESASAKRHLPVPPRFIADQVAVQIQKSLSQGNDKISIQLRPAELGKVEVRLEVGHEGRVTAVITADRADTLDLLQRDARILQSSLQDAGLRADSNSLSFELRGNGQSFDQAHDGTGNARGSGDAGVDGVGSPDAAAPMARPGIIANDRVDIHV